MREAIEEEGFMAPKQSFATAFFLSALFLASAAQALELYGGAGGVKTTLSGGCDAANNASSSHCDQGSSGYKAFVGFQLIPLTAIEVGYVDFGKAEGSGTVSGSFRNFSLEANSIYVAGVLRATVLDRVTVFGKLGVQRWDAKGNLGSSSLGTQHSDNGYNGMGGVGLSVRIIGPLGIIGEVERYQGVGNSDTTGKANINVYSLGIVARF
jgi:OOP family OmpA-OmpF porin